ncbi:unnamed protein product [Closterium sp. Yama58-4]|nr:unnamed protein product [Closterium sp. Yama58-4]
MVAGWSSGHFLRPVCLNQAAPTTGLAHNGAVVEARARLVVRVQQTGQCITTANPMGNKVTKRRYTVEEQYTHPQGLYPHRDIDLKKLRRLILDAKLAPCHVGGDEPSSDLDECPICFLNYPCLNRSRCCKKGMCTECFLQMKSPTASSMLQCPFCKAPTFSVEFRGKRTAEERNVELEEEQKVIEAKIRMRQEEEEAYAARVAERQAAAEAASSLNSSSTSSALPPTTPPPSRTPPNPPTSAASAGATSASSVAGESAGEAAAEAAAAAAPAATAAASGSSDTGIGVLRSSLQLSSSASSSSRERGGIGRTSSRHLTSSNSSRGGNQSTSHNWWEGPFAGGGAGAGAGVRPNQLHLPGGGGYSPGVNDGGGRYGAGGGAGGVGVEEGVVVGGVVRVGARVGSGRYGSGSGRGVGAAGAGMGASGAAMGAASSHGSTVSPRLSPSRADELGVDLEELLLMEAIWLSLQVLLACSGSLSCYRLL